MEVEEQKEITSTAKKREKRLLFLRVIPLIKMMMKIEILMIIFHSLFVKS